MENQQNFGLKFNNFDPSSLDVEEVLNAVFILDCSPSMQQDNAIDALNENLNAFVQEMTGSHIADKLMVSTLTFCEDIDVLHGFKPITDVQSFDLKTRGRATRLFDSVSAGIDNAVNYREQLEKTGINCKTLIFIITDGEDNQSKSGAAAAVKAKIESILKDEKNTFSFTTILFGVGEQANFEHAQKEMGIQHLAKVGYSGKEIRKMINFISSSISSSASGKTVSTINF